MKVREGKVIFTAEKPEDLTSGAKLLLDFAGDDRITAFYGEMGSGKTTFIKAICEVLGTKDRVSSPTFAIVNEYEGALGNKIYHFDFYRINKDSEALDIGINDYFASGAYCFIEWPENILNLLPSKHVRVTLSVENQKRLITFSYD